MTLLDKIRNVRHGNPPSVSAALETYLNGIKPSASELAAGRQQIGEFMRRRVLQLQNAVLRHLAVPGLALLIGIGSAARPERRQPRPGSVRQTAGGQCGPPADAAKDNQRKTDEFVEAAQAINGPAGNPECVWLGRRVVRLMWRDDLDTAFRHLDLYDRFGCPGGHVQATFRCLTRFGAQIDPKVAETPEQPGSCLLDQSRGPAAGGRGGHAGRAHDRRQRRAGARRGAARRGAPLRQRRPNNPDRDRNDRKFSRFGMVRALKTPWRHKSC